MGPAMLNEKAANEAASLLKFNRPGAHPAPLHICPAGRRFGAAGTGGEMRT